MWPHLKTHKPPSSIKTSLRNGSPQSEQSVMSAIVKDINIWFKIVFSVSSHSLGESVSYISIKPQFGDNAATFMGKAVFFIVPSDALRSILFICKLNYEIIK